MNTTATEFFKKGYKAALAGRHHVRWLQAAAKGWKYAEWQEYLDGHDKGRFELRDSLIAN